jgi:hypothetical protein
MEVFKEVLTPLVEVTMPKTRAPTCTTLTLTLLLRNVPKGSLIVSKFASCLIVI